MQKFSWVDQFVMSYGGLRGAIAYGLVESLPESPTKGTFLTASIAIILFTVFVQVFNNYSIVDEQA
jgi:NhaP-type Na+/H+ or K+/H+ antiporter